MGKPTDRSDSMGVGFGEFRPGGGAGVGVVWMVWMVWMVCGGVLVGVWWSLVVCGGVWWSLVGV